MIVAFFTFCFMLIGESDMEFNELIAEFAVRHNVENLVVEDGFTALDIDGIIVSIVSSGEIIVFSADIGEPPPEGSGVFANLLLEANLKSDVFFAKDGERDVYVIVRRFMLSALDSAALDEAIEAFVNQTETWRQLLADFRPAAETAAENDEAESSAFGSNGFIQV